MGSLRKGGNKPPANNSRDAAVTPTVFAVACLRALGLPLRREAIEAFIGWELAEGGHWHNKARYNPLNTTMNAPGASNTGAQGNIKVYTSWRQGVDATVRTLKLPAYTGILNAFRTGTKAQIAQAVDASPWGTHDVAAIAGTSLANAGIAAVTKNGGSAVDAIIGVGGDVAGAILNPAGAAVDAVGGLLGGVTDPISAIGKFLSVIVSPAEWGKILAETFAVILRYLLAAIYKYALLPPWHWTERAVDDYAATNVLRDGNKDNLNKALVTIGFWGLGYGLLWGRADETGISLTQNKHKKTILGGSAQKALNLAKRKNLRKNTEEATPEKPESRRTVVPLTETRRVSATRRRTVTVKDKGTGTNLNEQPTGTDKSQTRTDETIPGRIGDGNVREVREIAS